MRKLLLISLISSSLVGLVVPVAAQASILVNVQPRAELTDEGTLLVDVRVNCSAEGHVLEAFVDVTQDDQTISGHGAISGIICDGRWRKHHAVVHVFEGQFHLGRARASAFVLVCTDTDCTQGQEVKYLRVR